MWYPCFPNYNLPGGVTRVVSMAGRYDFLPTALLRVFLRSATDTLASGVS
jgi:hypothetical protein